MQRPLRLTMSLSRFYDALWPSASTLCTCIFISNRRIPVNDNDDDMDPVLEVVLHLSKQDEQPPPSDEPKYVHRQRKSWSPHIRCTSPPMIDCYVNSVLNYISSFS